MKPIIDIYKEYKIFSGLQTHMLRVAAVAKIICDHSNIELDKESIISACLLHDMGNIIKSELEKFPGLLEPEGLEYWQSVQEEFFQKYGREEHVATFEIAQEIGVNAKTSELLNGIGFSQIVAAKEGGSLAQQICSYSDMRVAPHGLVPLHQRLDDLFERYKSRGKHDPVEFEKRRTILQELEKEIFSTTDISPDYINDETAAPVVEALKSYKIS